jgi:hypothetical protein
MTWQAPYEQHSMVDANMHLKQVAFDSQPTEFQKLHVHK